jgi:hypothetical protein
MDVMTISKLIERYEAYFKALAALFLLIVGVTTNVHEFLQGPRNWGWLEWIIVLVVLVVPGVLVIRALRGHASRLLDPNALRLDPQSPDQLIGRAEDLQKFLKTLVNPLVFLISESGCGKTALLRAGVEQHPDFTDRYLPIYIDMSALDWEDGPLRELRDGFARALPTDDPARSILKPQSGPSDYVSAFENYFTRSMHRPLLLLDQFDDYQAQSRLRDHFFPPQTQQWCKAEEITKQNAFWRVVRACVRANALHVVVAVRNEASPGLDCIRFFHDTPQFGLLRLPSGLLGRSSTDSLNGRKANRRSLPILSTDGPSCVNAWYMTFKVRFCLSN